ncbi:RnfABCDGE type electron transport complex subunit D [Gehongia tenuis]|jgi:electron transport complex protein RnfD|uniref:Ion-translocating oxidoreductase complex subunit D n=1 Tax=Gehongia tenuis TaxID=2763655 RepID=A0A926HPE0_9FIRM|nr:RnfABCDGE type electron transport complex subunit D [Gehongia tenuis]MBC8531559.1 RnfABCDGE type electron transport complex subunit D [Gehongia tenuis]
MNELLVVSSSPHIRGSLTVRKIMMDVTIALLPAGIMGVYFYGWHALLIMVLSVASAVLTEAVIQKLMKKPVTVNDFSAVVTGLLLAYNVPPTAPWWLPVVGSAFAIAIVKQCFGGLGHNFVNPALAGRAFLLVSWPVLMTNFVAPGLDAVASATPLALMKSGAVEQLPSLWNLFIGNIGGCIGETSALAILIGAAYLVAARLIDIRIPLSFIGTTALLTWIFGGQAGMFTGMPLHHILMGGLMLGAFFMATDYTTSPVSPKARIVFGIGCGVITSVIRIWGGYPEGVSYSILIMNIAAPLLDRFMKPKVFGEVKSRG